MKKLRLFLTDRAVNFDVIFSAFPPLQLPHNPPQLRLRFALIHIQPLPKNVPGIHPRRPLMPGRAARGGKDDQVAVEAGGGSDNGPHVGAAGQVIEDDDPFLLGVGDR